MVTRWGFTVKGGLIDKLRDDYALHAATAAYTLNDGIRNRLLAKNVEIAAQLDFLSAPTEGSK